PISPLFPYTTLFRSLPVSVVRAMNVDRLIVVDVGSPSRTAEEISNIVGVMDQLSGHMVRNTSAKQKTLMEAQDVLITPDLEGIYNTSFTDVDESLWQGYIATFAALQAHPYWQVQEEQQRTYETRVEMSDDKTLISDGTPTPVIEFIRVDNDGPV